MFGKHFASMYEGSMVGKGSAFFAVWGYVISHMKPDWKGGAFVELNPKLLSLILGEEEDKVRNVVEELLSPDPESRSKEEDGRRLIRIGEYTYRVVNGAKYRAIRNEEERRQQNRLAQERLRKKRKGEQLTGESSHQVILETKGQEAADQFVDHVGDESLSNRKEKAEVAP